MIRPASLACCLALATAAAGQEAQADPRFAPDPREVSDPRRSNDPRDTPTDQLDPSHPSFRFLTEGRQLFDGLLEAGNEEALLQVLREQSWDFVEYYQTEAQDWLLLANRPGTPGPEGLALLEAQRAKLLRLAHLADAATGDTRFESFALAVLSWSPEHRLQLTQMQDLQKQARHQQEAAQDAESLQLALTPLRQSLDLARRLGHVPAQADILRRLAQIQLANEHWEEARDQLREAIRVGREVRHRSAVWEGYEQVLSTHLAQGDQESAREVLLEWYQLAMQIGDEQVRQRATQRVIDFETADGMADLLNRFRLRDRLRDQILR